MLKGKVICFGDSWGAGAELQHNEKPFIHWVAKNFNVAYKNYSQPGYSLGMILHTLVLNIDTIQPDDLVIVVIPPDIRWYDQNKEKGFYSVENWQRDDYFKFLNNKTLEWFIYHHALFVYSIQKILNDMGCHYIMAHNYGQIDEIKKYKLKINFDKFLSNTNLTNLISAETNTWRSYPDHLPQTHQLNQDGPPAGKEFSGIYFEGCQCHPNELGHKYIAQLLLNKYEQLSNLP
jgi:hypothetical protein